MIDITEPTNRLLEEIEIRLKADPDRRILVALAGAPASGKSTLATELRRRLVLRKIPAQVVPMDGFHLDNSVLTERGLLPRKGAPETFDTAGFVACVRRLAEGGEVVVPVFDRTRDIAIAGAQVVAETDRVAILEGNYLLYDAEPWSELHALWDISVRLEVPLDDLRARLIQRWLSHGLSRAAAIRRAEGNDLPNARIVTERSLPADIVL